MISYYRLLLTVSVLCLYLTGYAEDGLSEENSEANRQEVDSLVSRLLVLEVNKEISLTYKQMEDCEKSISKEIKRLGILELDDKNEKRGLPLDVMWFKYGCYLIAEDEAKNIFSELQLARFTTIKSNKAEGWKTMLEKLEK